MLVSKKEGASHDIVISSIVNAIENTSDLCSGFDSLHCGVIRLQYQSNANKKLEKILWFTVLIPVSCVMPIRCGFVEWSAFMLDRAFSRQELA